MLRGELNGDKPLEQAFSFAEELGDEVAEDPVAETPESPTISGYQSLTDDTGVLTVDVPIEWADVDTAPFTLDCNQSFHDRIHIARQLIQIDLLDWRAALVRFAFGLRRLIGRRRRLRA